MRENSVMRYPLYLPGESRGGSAVRLPDVPLLVLVGLTGVGKSSLLEALAFPTLPDRRELVDRYVLPLFGAVPPLDRKARFEITRRFRETHPGGVAEILAKALVEPVWPLVFDGLRGEAEVRYALDCLPLARFVALEASDLTRLSRLLDRNDWFDQMRKEVSGNIPSEILRAADGVLSKTELQTALSWGYSPEDLLAKLKIVSEERKNYDPAGPRKLLGDSPRAIFLDTQALSVEQEVDAIRAFVKGINANH